jgi:hypothetical protein
MSWLAFRPHEPGVVLTAVKTEPAVARNGQS